jgi:tetratricopeptide (TPR) repeat protein
MTLVDRRSQALGLLAATLVLALSRWPLPAAETEKTVLQDHLLIARAAVELGFDAEALSATRAALAHTPGDEAARELLCVALFNRWLRGAQRLQDVPLAPCQDAAAFSSGARRVLGIAWWRLGREREAIAIWQDLVANYPEEREQALAALLMTNHVSAWYVTLDWRTAAQWDDALLLALAIKGHPRAPPLVAQRFTLEETQRQGARLERMFDQRAPGRGRGR